MKPQAKLTKSKRMLTSLMLTPEPQQKTQKKEKHLDSPRSRPSSSNGNGSSKKCASMKGASSSKGSSSKPSRLNSLRSAGSSMNVKKKMRHSLQLTAVATVRMTLNYLKSTLNTTPP